MSETPSQYVWVIPVWPDDLSQARVIRYTKLRETRIYLVVSDYGREKRLNKGGIFWSHHREEVAQEMKRRKLERLSNLRAEIAQLEKFRTIPISCVPDKLAHDGPLRLNDDDDKTDSVE